MEYRVEELARAAGVRVDTVRFYQTRGLIPPPRRRGRIAIYDASHLERVREVRELNRQGISLDAIRRLRAPAPCDGVESDLAAATRASPTPPEGASARLLAALDSVSGAPTYTSDALSAASGFPVFLLNSMRELGLLEARETPDGPLYGESDRTALDAAKRLLDSGIPLGELLPLAREHAAHIDSVAGRAVELFERHVRRKEDPAAPDPESVTTTFRDLLPQVTRLVALHFERALLRQARVRLHRREDSAIGAEPARPEVASGPRAPGSSAPPSIAPPPVSDEREGEVRR